MCSWQSLLWNLIFMISDKINILNKRLFTPPTAYIVVRVTFTANNRKKFKMFWFLVSLQLVRMRYHKDIIIWDRKKCLLVKKCINCITFNILQVKNLLKVKIVQANKTKMCRENREQEKHTTSTFSTFPIQNTV